MRADIEADLQDFISNKRGSVRDWITNALSSGLILSEKQVLATLEKWTRKGWYEYGVSLDHGWWAK